MGTMAAPPFKGGIHGTGNTSHVFFMRSSPSCGPLQPVSRRAGACSG